jgi:hypothetical protein
MMLSSRPTGGHNDRVCNSVRINFNTYSAACITFRLHELERTMSTDVEQGGLIYSQCQLGAMYLIGTLNESWTCRVHKL